MDSLKIAKLKRAHQEFFKTNKNQKIKSRINYLKKLKRVIDVNENLIYEALHKDLKKPIFESFASEILMIQKEIDFFTKNLKALSELILFCEFIQFFAISSISRTSFKRPLKCVLSGYDIIAFR